MSEQSSARSRAPAVGGAVAIVLIISTAVAEVEPQTAAAEAKKAQEATAKRP